MSSGAEFSDLPIIEQAAARAKAREAVFGSVCPNGHAMQATGIAWLELDENGEAVDDARPFFDSTLDRFKATSICASILSAHAIYCSEDCDLPADLILAARELFAKEYPL